MKKEMFKKLLPGYILAFVTSFMFFIYEPLLMYSTNINEFWFDLYKILGTNIFVFLISLAFMVFIHIVVYFIDKKFAKNNIILNLFTVIWFGIFLVLYIQGNYLIGDLPSLDGKEIIWHEYKMQNIVSIILCELVFFVFFILVSELKFEKTINIIKYITIGIFGMLFISLVTTLVTTEDVLDRKKAVYMTTENFGTYSKDENFIIFLVDAVDSIKFNEVLKKNNEYNNVFEDFTYFPDTLSAYPYTRDSIPFIVSGVWNENNTAFDEYSNKAYNESILLDTLKEEEYDMNIYQKNLVWTDKKVNNIENVKFVKDKINKKRLITEEIKYILFKYLPFPLKRVSKIEGMDFDSCKIKGKEKKYSFKDKEVYNLINNTAFNKVDKKQFKFIHIEGAHVPFDYDKDLNKIKNGTYEQKIEATLTIINSYIKKLKDNDLYNNSNIIIMSDHGFSEGNGAIGRQNPILYIKGINEKHPMYQSDLPISYADLSEAYLDLIDGKNSEELFQNVNKDRTRRFIFYRYTKENHMVEYIQTGKAWDEETLLKTGKEFNR